MPGPSASPSTRGGIARFVACAKPSSIRSCAWCGRGSGPSSTARSRPASGDRSLRSKSGNCRQRAVTRHDPTCVTLAGAFAPRGRDSTALLTGEDKGQGMATKATGRTTIAKASAAKARATTNGGGNGAAPTPHALQELLRALTAARDGDFSVRLPARRGSVMGEIAAVYNQMADTNARMAKELVRVSRVIGREGRMTERMTLTAPGAWGTSRDSVNSLIDDLARPTTEVARVIEAVAEGDLSQKMALKIEGQPVKGEFLRIGTAVNSMVDQLSSFASEVTRVAREVGTEGKLGGQAKVKGVSGTWKELTDNVNFMASNLTDQVRNIAQVATAVARGDLTQKITVEAKGEVAALAETINRMTDTLSSFADEVTRVAREVGTDGRLGGQAQVEGVSGTWKDLTDNVNFKT